MIICGIRECRSPGDAIRPHVLARKTSVCGARRCTEGAHASPNSRSVCNPQWSTYGAETSFSRTAMISNVSRPLLYGTSALSRCRYRSRVAKWRVLDCHSRGRAALPQHCRGCQDTAVPRCRTKPRRVDNLRGYRSMVRVDSAEPAGCNIGSREQCGRACLVDAGALAVAVGYTGAGTGCCRRYPKTLCDGNPLLRNHCTFCCRNLTHASCIVAGTP
jgi:hypothetical protein